MTTNKKVLCETCMTNIPQSKLIPPPKGFPNYGYSCPICSGYISYEKATR